MRAVLSTGFIKYLPSLPQKISTRGMDFPHIARTVKHELLPSFPDFALEISGESAVEAKVQLRRGRHSDIPGNFMPQYQWEAKVARFSITEHTLKRRCFAT